jgi:hypothetical protein
MDVVAGLIFCVIMICVWTSEWLEERRRRK